MGNIRLDQKTPVDRKLPTGAGKVDLHGVEQHEQFADDPRRRRSSVLAVCEHRRSDSGQISRFTKSRFPLKSGHQALNFVMTRRSIGNGYDEQCEIQISRLIEKILDQCRVQSTDELFHDSQWCLMRDTFREILIVWHRYRSPDQQNVNTIINACTSIMRK